MKCIPKSIISIRTVVLLVSIWSWPAKNDIHHRVAASVISANKASTTNFELQTNLISCTAEENHPMGAATTTASSAAAGVVAGTRSDTTSANGKGSGPSALSVPVCSPPESKLFSNIKIVDGTPRPGATGIRGRLYDVGKLCNEKVTDRIDRAWVAFLDCAGCSLTTKLANLEGSNPQAVLIYNQTSCIFPSPLPHSISTSVPIAATTLATTTTATATATVIVTTTTAATVTATVATTGAPISFSSSSTAVAAPAVTTTTTQGSPVATSTQPPGNGNNNGGKEGGGNSDSNGGSGSGGEGDKGGDGSEGASIHRRSDIGSNSNINENDDYEPLLYKLLHPVIVGSARLLNRRGETYSQEKINRGMLGRQQSLGTTVATVNADDSQATLRFPSTVAMADQGTAEYLFQMLLGPASLMHPPEALKHLKETAVHSTTATGKAGQQGGSNVITDFMVSISPSIGDASPPSGSKHLALSKPVFGAIVGILSATVCGLILMYVVRPLVLRRRNAGKSKADSSGEHGSAALYSHTDGRDSTDSGDGAGSSSNSNGYRHHGFQDRAITAMPKEKCNMGDNNIHTARGGYEQEHEEGHGYEHGSWKPAASTRFNDDHIQIDISEEKYGHAPEGKNRNLTPISYGYDEVFNQQQHRQSNEPQRDLIQREDTTHHHLNRLLQRDLSDTTYLSGSQPEPNVATVTAATTTSPTPNWDIVAPSPFGEAKQQPEINTTDTSFDSRVQQRQHQHHHYSRSTDDGTPIAARNRNGSDLFHLSNGQHSRDSKDLPRSSSSRQLPTVDTARASFSTSAVREGGLATALRRSMDASRPSLSSPAPGYTSTAAILDSTPAIISLTGNTAMTTTGNTNAITASVSPVVPRSSFSSDANDRLSFSSPRRSTDSYRYDFENQSNEIASTSLAYGHGNGQYPSQNVVKRNNRQTVPKASFVDDHTRPRLSLDALPRPKAVKQ
ncbi:hypothetical protein BX616_010712 [Lobosporangium transversale]|uniref:Uncharacterized protein n=1 Tax=Lobosporangium transversale TaxID=64571 RepID=A0A1Y2GUJ0_9FUNG|nr:hypothetical protein BCR41DRAFT_394688 [Lobosporangium transversale]KAF9910997.1 hypothetical protein BX616_010712 [Lobosporangium transversale]ORZ21936.1 hypothetical protein BCR41DRAFT_394688 [Lobosporangium transversale]|eukprot:XP_021883187.1 hypothetical protein BCR41DRAFT_394688 [Lobosporangium transversale]